MRKSISMFAFVLLMAAAVSASPVLNTSWTVKLTPDAAAAAKDQKAFDDTLVFDADGKVTMTACVAHGFAASPYTMARAMSRWLFRTTQKSATEGTTLWSGYIAADTITGTLDWTASDGTIYHYTFAGKKNTPSAVE